MWFLTIISVIVLGVLSKADENLCDQIQPVHCFTPDLGLIKFPDSVEALDKICPILKSHLMCVMEYSKKCGFTYPIGSIEERYPFIYEIVEEACDKESSFYKDLSPHLSCMENAFIDHDSLCMPMVDEAMIEITRDLYLERDPEGGLVKAEPDLAKKPCFKEALKWACLEATISVQCGKDAKDLAEEVRKRVEFLQTICYESKYFYKAQSLAAMLRPELEEKLEEEQVTSYLIYLHGLLMNLVS